MMKKIDECFSQIEEAENEHLEKSYQSFLDEMHEKGVDAEDILSFYEYKRFYEFQKRYFYNVLCFGDLDLVTIDKWNEDFPQAKISYLDY